MIKVPLPNASNNPIASAIRDMLLARPGYAPDRPHNLPRGADIGREQLWPDDLRDRYYRASLAYQADLIARMLGVGKYAPPDLDFGAPFDQSRMYNDMGRTGSLRI